MNLFDAANYPTREPAQLVVGDRWAWKRADLAVDYPVASYSLKYSLRLLGAGTTEIEITAGETGGEYVIEVASATTAGKTAGTYAWQAYITRTSDSERVLVGQGTVELVANRDVATTEPRSYARRMLAAIEAVMENRASKDQEEYSIQGRSLKRTSLPDLMVWRDRFREEVRQELAAERMAQGMGSDRFAGIRLRRV